MNDNIKKSILVVDDDEEVLAVLEEVLIYSDFKVKAMRQANDILNIIDDYKPDLVLMDYILTGVNGGEICHYIKTNPQTSGIPVIIISAYPRVLESLGTYGCNAFIAKSFNISDLISGINDCFLLTT